MEKRASNTSPAAHFQCDQNDQKPLPTNFDEFLPWACVMLQESYDPVVTRSTQYSYDTSTTKGKKEKPLENDLFDLDSEASDKANDSSDSYYTKRNEVHIETIYDTNNVLVQLKLMKNNKIPRSLLKLISLIIPFHPQLSAISINKGLTQGGLYEIAKTVASSYLTEIILDGAVIREGNYYCLLDNKTNLKHLSLARCNINDAVVKELTVRLFYPLPMSKILSALNLSSNRITNIGAKDLAEMLKTNRQLAYLNLAGNLITDVGMDTILNSLIEFPLSIDQIVVSKTRKHAYLKQKSDMIQRTIEEMLSIDLRKLASKSKSDKIAYTKRQKESRIQHKDTIIRSKLDEESYGELAENAVNAQMGPFCDPFSSENTIFRNGTVYCLGNNALCYLSLAYNDLSNISVKKLYFVLNTQHILNRNPRGLVNICIDGNDISDSNDLANISFLISRGLAAADVPAAVSTTTKKKGGSTK